MKRFTGSAVFIFAFAACASAAGAHVRVFTQSGGETTKACGYEKFIVRVPVEKPNATIGVNLRIPPGVTVFATQPNGDWHADFKMDRGRISEIDWSGGRLQAHQFDEFAFLAGTPKSPARIDWNADQIYDDKSVVHWTGAPGSESPHSQTTIVRDDAACGRHPAAGGKK